MILANLFSERIPDWLGWLLVFANLFFPWQIMKFARQRIEQKVVWLLYPASQAIILFFTVIVLILWVGLTGSYNN